MSMQEKREVLDSCLSSSLDRLKIVYDRYSEAMSPKERTSLHLIVYDFETFLEQEYDWDKNYDKEEN